MTPEVIDGWTPRALVEGVPNGCRAIDKLAALLGTTGS